VSEAKRSEAKWESMRVDFVDSVRKKKETTA
jgi:hypothetical protein